MKTGPAIYVKDVRKTFKTHRKANTFKDLLTYHEKDRDRKYHEVLKGITFDVNKGESLAIIGRNGSGKSTILKLLTGILTPDEGRIAMDGKIACLIELGAGFHPDMTGRENVYINASIFGLGKKEVDAKFQEILEFSEIGDAIDERVRNYSSGMYLRLAFSVAISVDADILLVDEILAVGDINFQKKCIDRLQKFKESGGTIVLVTHNTAQAREMCDRVMWLDDGEIRMLGDPETVCGCYEKFMMTKNEETNEDLT